MSRIILYIEILIAIILYLCAPKIYSLQFCYTCFLLFVLAFILIYKNRLKTNLFQFEFIFSIAFFFTNFTYPIFYYPIKPYFSLFHLSFPEEYISSGCALATIGYLAFCIGILKYKAPKRHIDISDITNRFKAPLSYISICIILTLLLILSLYNILLSGVYDGNWGDGTILKVLADIFIYYIIFSKLTSGRNLRKIFLENKLFFLVVLCYILEITIIGNRGLIMRFMILISFLYTTFYKKINNKVIIGAIIGGMLLMFYVGAIRGEGTFTEFKNQDIPVILQIGQDLTINNRSLYVLMEYYHNYGASYGQTWLANILSMIPFGQSFYLNFTGKSLEDINSANLVTDIYFSGTTEDVFGLGTNLIGDIYICFGLIGVIIFMYILGIILSYTMMKGFKGNLICLFIYTMIFADCIILTRASYLTSVRNITWGLALYFISNVKFART